jgi:hypothetical protein
MSIKITLGQLSTAASSQALAHTSALIPPGSYQFRAAKLLDAVEKELEGIRKQNNALIKKYGVAQTVEKDGKQVPTGNISMVDASPENVVAFNDAMTELLNSETTIPYEPIIWSKLGEEAQRKLTINDVRALGPLLVEELPGAEPAPATPLKAV